MPANDPNPDLTTPKGRQEFLIQHGLRGFYLVSRDELSKLGQGAQMVETENEQWRALIQGMLGVRTPKDALEVAKSHQASRKKLLDERQKYRRFIIEIAQGARTFGELRLEARAILNPS